MCPRICKNCQLNCSVGPGETALVIALTCSVGHEATQIVLVLELQLHLGYSNLHIRPSAAVMGLPLGSDDRLVTVLTINLIAQRHLPIARALCKGKYKAGRKQHKKHQVYSEQPRKL